MRPCKLKLNEKQRRLSLIIEFILSGESLVLQHWKFSNKSFVRYVIRTLFPVISVFRMECVNDSLKKKMFIL